MKCPNYGVRNCKPECKHPLLRKDLNRVYDEEMYERWSQMSITRAIDQSEDMSWCPTPGCGYAFVKTGAQLNCPQCRKNVCLDCRCDWHEGQTCEQYQATAKQRQEEVETKKYLKDVVKAKQCKKCKYWVSRTKGCRSIGAAALWIRPTKSTMIGEPVIISIISFVIINNLIRL